MKTEARQHLFDFVQAFSPKIGRSKQLGLGLLNQIAHRLYVKVPEKTVSSYAEVDGGDERVQRCSSTGLHPCAAHDVDELIEVLGSEFPP